MNNIRNARLEDINQLVSLLTQLGYPNSIDFYEKQLENMLAREDFQILVYELEGKVVALVSIHFYAQLIFEGEIANLGIFIVDKDVRGKGIGRVMEEYVTQLAKERRCALIEVFSKERRKDAHRFYNRQGYIERHKFFEKELK
ncbi:MAG: GNAT family N-acetyltransferase [Dysgonomonas sp.]